jgi:DNA-binding response OmpR family regulator
VRTIVVASDTAAVRREVASAISGPDAYVREVAAGPDVLATVQQGPTDLVIVDMQMGSMGGMAVCLDLRLEESMERIDHVPVLLLLDRRADVFLARRSAAEGWLVKPLDPRRIRRATRTLLAGREYQDDSYQPVPVLAGASAPAARPVGAGGPDRHR